MGESKGYRATIEKEILGGVGKIDVALERDDEKIACEISVTTSHQHELANVQKCLAAGYRPTVLLSADEKVLKRLRKAISSVLEQEALENVLFLQPEDLLAHLDKPITPRGDTQTIRGYRVQVHYQRTAQRDEKTKKAAVSNVILGALKRLK